MGADSAPATAAPTFAIGDFVFVGGDWNGRRAEVRYLNRTGGAVVRWTDVPPHQTFASDSYVSVPLTLLKRAS